MGYNKIPLALRYNDTTNNAEGLIEFQLNLSDVGDVCGGEPGTGQALVYHADGEWCPSTLPAPGAFNGNLSDVGQVCDNQPTEGQALVWSGSVWCPSTIPTGGGGGGDPLPTATNAGDIILADGPGTAYSASAPSDAGIMQLDPYFDANDEGAVAQWDGTKLEVVFPDQLYMLVQAGENLSKGDVVYVTGDTGSGRFIVAKADASDPSKMPAVGLVPAAISNEGNGKIVSFGRAIGLNTAGMIVGKPVYVATTPGGITKDKPTGATELIQNIGIVSVVDGTNGVIKVTGVGRSNDIPVNVDVVGSATIGTNEFTQTSAKLANVDADHILISTATSATSSIASATLFGNYYTKSEADTAFLEDADNAVTPTNLDSTIANQYDIPYRSTTDTFTHTTATSQSIAFLGTQATLGDLSDASVESATEGQALIRSGENTWIASTLDTGAGFVDGPTVSATFSSIEVDDIKVNRLLESRPTCITHFSDWLSLDVRNNGYSPSLAGGASHVQDSSLVTMNTTEYGIGVLRLKTSTSVTNSQSRVMTYDSTVAPSTCGVSFAARVCPSGAWTTGVNEGVITMGIHNRSNSINLHPNAGAWFQYDHSSSNWQAITGWFTVSSNTDTGVSATPESFQVLQIMIDENWQTFEFYIDGSAVATHVIGTDNVPTSSRYGFTFSVRNGSLAGPGSFTNGGNELFLDWDYRKLTHTATDRGEGYIKKTLSGE
jgi:hypothetical protein